MKLGVAFLVLQSAAILYAQVTPDRYFCWAPFHAQTKYQISAQLRQKKLSEQEISARYKLITIFWDPTKHEWWELNEINHVFRILSQYESTYGAGEDVEIEVIYDENGHGPQTWKWP
jgi:hypothetical protein